MNPTNHPPTNTPPTTFKNIPYGSAFVLHPGGRLPFIKVGETLADVPPHLRMHPDAPRAGFFHPAPFTDVVALSAEELALLAGPRKSHVEGLRAIQIDREGGMIGLLFDSGEARLEFAKTLPPQLGDDVTCRMGRINVEGDECFRIAFSFRDLKSNLTILLPKSLE